MDIHTCNASHIQTQTHTHTFIHSHADRNTTTHTHIRPYKHKHPHTHTNARTHEQLCTQAENTGLISRKRNPLSLYILDEYFPKITIAIELVAETMMALSLKKSLFLLLLVSSTCF